MKYSVVLIGLGNISMGYDKYDPSAIWTHLRAIYNNKNFILKCAIDPVKEKRDNFQSLTMLPAFSDLDEFYKGCSNDIDVFVIASPTESHFEIIESIISIEPKLIIVEKPVVKNFDDIEKIKHIKDKIMVNLFRLYLPRLNSELERLSSEYCYVNIRYSKGIVHNGIHFISLLMKHFGAILKFSVNTLNERQVISIELERCNVIAEPCLSELDDNSMTIQSTNEILHYLNGGREILVTKNNRTSYISDDEFRVYQSYLYDGALEFIETGVDQSFELAMDSQEKLMNIESLLKNS